MNRFALALALATLSPLAATAATTATQFARADSVPAINANKGDSHQQNADQREARADSVPAVNNNHTGSNTAGSTTSVG